MQLLAMRSSAMLAPLTPPRPSSWPEVWHRGAARVATSSDAEGVFTYRARCACERWRGPVL